MSLGILVLFLVVLQKEKKLNKVSRMSTSASWIELKKLLVQLLVLAPAFIYFAFIVTQNDFLKSRTSNVVREVRSSGNARNNFVDHLYKTKEKGRIQGRSGQLLLNTLGSGLLIMFSINSRICPLHENRFKMHGLITKLLTVDRDQSDSFGNPFASDIDRRGLSSTRGLCSELYVV